MSYLTDANILIEKKDNWRLIMNKTRTVCKVLGVALLSFGLGILSSFFLPATVFIVIESILIIAVGLIYFSCK